MKTVSFELTMPNVGSWNGKWTGADKKYFVIKKFTDKFIKQEQTFQSLLEKGHDSWYYNFGDGWGANIRAEVIDGREAAKRRKASSGFCGYEWMVQSIISHGKIQTS